MSENNAILNGFKNTELGPLPEEWEVIKLGKIIKYNLGRTPPRSEKKYWNNGTIPWVSIADMKQNHVITHTKENVSEEAFEKIFKSTISKKGTLLMSFKLTIGRTSFLDIDATHNEAIISIYPEDNIGKFFLYYYLPQVDYSNYMDRAVKGNTLNKSKIERILIPLPPLPEQRAIASVLSSVQQAKEKTETVISATRALKKSLMQHLFMYGPVPVKEAEQVSLKETEIGEVPEEWGEVRLEKVIAKGPQNGIYKPQSVYGEGTLIVRIDDYDNEGGIVTRASNRVKLSAEELKKYRLNTSDILINRVNSLSHLGKTALIGPLTEPVVFESNMMRFGVDTNFVTPEYVFRFLSSPFCRQQMRGKAKRAVAQSSINQGDVKSLTFLVPELPVQQKITESLSSVDRNIEVEENKKRALDELFKTLLHDLMTAKLRVNHLEVEA